MRWETVVMEECAGIAEVTRVTKHPVVEIAESVEVGGPAIHARMYAPGWQTLARPLSCEDFETVRVRVPSSRVRQRRLHLAC
jgi:hypothetical protein